MCGKRFVGMKSWVLTEIPAQKKGHYCIMQNYCYIVVIYMRGTEKTRINSNKDDDDMMGRRVSRLDKSQNRGRMSPYRSNVMTPSRGCPSYWSTHMFQLIDCPDSTSVGHFLAMVYAVD